MQAAMRRFHRHMYLLLLCLTALLWSLTFYFACFIIYRSCCRKKKAEEDKAHGTKAVHLLKTIASAKVLLAVVTTIACWIPATVSCDDSGVLVTHQKQFIQLRTQHPDRIIVTLFLILPAFNAFLGILCFGLSRKTALNDEDRTWPVLSLFSMVETIVSLVIFFLTGFIYSFCVEFWRRSGQCTVDQRPWMLAIYSSYAAAICGTAITIIMGFLSYFVPGQKMIDELETIGDEAEKAVSDEIFVAECVDETLPENADSPRLPFAVNISANGEVLVSNLHSEKWIAFKVVPTPSIAFKTHSSSFVLSPGSVHPIKLTQRGNATNKTQRFKIHWMLLETNNIAADDHAVWNHWNMALSSGVPCVFTNENQK